MLIFIFTKGYIMFSNKSGMFEIIGYMKLQIFISLILSYTERNILI